MSNCFDAGEFHKNPFQKSSVAQSLQRKKRNFFEINLLCVEL
jgi:hypothetical protein